PTATNTMTYATVVASAAGSIAVAAVKHSRLRADTAVPPPGKIVNPGFPQTGRLRPPSRPKSKGRRWSRRILRRCCGQEPQGKLEGTVPLRIRNEDVERTGESFCWHSASPHDLVDVLAHA